MRYAGLGIIIGLAPWATWAGELPEIHVHEAPLSLPNVSDTVPQEAMGVYGDGGDYLRGLTGVSGIRFGGHGVDPVIRGQSQNRINVLLDGAFVYGGCPNRMDPPTSYAVPETYDRITVLRGVQSVAHGPGGSGGTVLFERSLQPLADGERWRATVLGGYAANGDVRDLAVDGLTGTERATARGIVGYQNAGNYRDGDGNTVPSAYERRHANLMFGYALAKASRLELGLEATRGEDMLYIGGMDSPRSDSDSARLAFERDAPAGVFDSVRTEFYRTDVTHVMDNFSLRELTAAMAMEVPSESLTLGGRVAGEVRLAGGHTLNVGVDHQANQREAVRYVYTMSGRQAESLMWPDVDIRQTGVFGELERELSESGRIKGGVRYDRVEASAGRAGEDPWPANASKLSPNDLYLRYYGIEAERHTEDNIGGFLRYERDLAGTDATWFLAASRSLRTADATERFMAANAAGMGEAWVGNPALAPERHHQLELGVLGARPRWEFGASVFFDRVSDYILRDMTTGVTPAAIIYRNVDAELYGAELESRLHWTQHWSSRFTLAYVHATNTTDDRPIAQTPPLEANLGLDYRQARWEAGGNLRLVDRQDRVDTASGVDPGESAGFGVVDLYGRVALARQVDVRLGVDNVFDKTYAEHLTRTATFDSSNLRVNEPGRNLWARLNARF